jgi:hypothetical protein
MRERINPESMLACHRLVDRCFEKFVGPHRPRPNLALSPDERARCIATGVITPAPPSASISSILAAKKRSNKRQKVRPNYGKISAVARQYLSRARIHGEMEKFSSRELIPLDKLRAAIKREQKALMGRAAA